MVRVIQIAGSVLLFIAAAVFTVMTTLHLPWTRWLFLYGSYYIVGGLCIGWAITYFRSFRFDPRGLLKPEVIVFAVLTAVIFIAAQPHLRVLPDEANLISVSKSLLETKKTTLVTMGKWFDFNFHPVQEYPPTRPILFPFATSIIHTLTGYRPENAIALNALLLFALFLLTYRIFANWLGTAAGYLSVFLCAAQPIVILIAASGGFDLFALFMIVLSFFYLFRYLLGPSELRFRLLWIQLLLLCHVRYESFLFTALIITLLFVAGRIPLNYFTQSLVYPLSPILAAPVIWQNYMNLTVGQYTNGPLMNLNIWREQAGVFFHSFLIFDGSIPYAMVISWLGVIGLIILGIKVLLNLKRYDRSILTAGLITTICVVVYWFFITGFRSKDVAEATTARLFNLFFYVLSCSAAVILAKIPWLKTKPTLLIVTGLSAFLFFQPLSVVNTFYNSLSLTRSLREVRAFLKKQSDPHCLIISDHYVLYTLYNYSSIGFKYANSKKQEILKELEKHRYTRIFVLQDISYAKKGPYEFLILDPAYRLVPLHEIQYADQAFLRISEAFPSQTAPETEVSRSASDSRKNPSSPKTERKAPEPPKA